MKLRFFALALAVIAAAAAAPATAQDAATGAVIFGQRCQMCHSVTPGQPSTMAPSLIGVVGRRAGSTAFDYSAALKGSGITWNKALLDQFLTAPYALVPGTLMPVAIADAKERADVVAYLASLKK
jgi:cytochrome c